MVAINHPKKVIFVVLVSSVILAYFILGLKSNNAIEVWLDPNDPQLATYRHFLETFGSEEFILVVIEKDKVFGPEDLALEKHLGQALEKIPGIGKVSSMADFYLPGLVDFASFKQMILSEPVFRKTWVSKGGKIWALFIQLDHFSQRDRASLVKQVRAALKNVIPEGERYHLAGPPVFNVTLDNYSRRAALIFFPLIFLLAGLVLWAIYQSFFWTVLSLMVAGIVILWSLAGLALFHHDLNMVTSALPPLLLVISLSYILHFFNAYQQEGTLGLAMRRVNKPIFLSSLTTSLGFGSLVVSNIGPIRDFGFAAAFGAILAYLLVLTFLPASLGALNPTTTHRATRESPRDRVIGRFLQRIGDINLKKSWLILSLSILSLIGAVIYLRQLKVEVNALYFLKQNNPMVHDYRFIEDHLMGLSPMEIVVKLPQGNSSDHEALTAIRELQSFLEKQPEIVNTFSLLDWQRAKQQIIKRLMFTGSFLGMAPERLEGLKREMDRYYDPTGMAWRISCRVKTLGSSEYKRLIQRIEKYTLNYPPSSSGTTITGLVPLLITVQDTLLGSQLKSFALAGVVIALVMLVLVRSFKPFIMAMIPNLWPIGLTFGFMGLARIPLDIATVMVASIALGLAADNTIHFIYRFREELKKGEHQAAVMYQSLQGKGIERGDIKPFSHAVSYAVAMYQTLHGIGRAMIFTSLVTASGFSVLCLSQFKPMVYFGMLSTVAIVGAMLADLFLHPVLLLLFVPKYRREDKDEEPVV